MKILKIKIVRSANVGGGTHYTYPSSYNAGKVIFGPVYDLPDNVSGQLSEYIIVGIRDTDSASFLAGNGVEENGIVNEITEISQEDAIALGDVRVPQIQKITNPTIVLEICAKAALGVELTQEEQDAINPDNSAIGINKTKSFTERLAEALVEYA